MNKKIIINLILISFIFASDSERPKVGLVLSGGGAKGFAHIGALKILDSLKIPIDYIVGTSIGAIAGAMYSIGYSGNEIEQVAKSTDWEVMFTDQVPRRDLPYFEKKDYGKYQLEFRLKKLKPIQPDGFIQGQNSLLELNKIFYNYNYKSNFNNFSIPFKCISTDIVTGNQVVIDSGILPKAVRSSLSIPTVFAPVVWGDSLLIDGGIINNLPTDVVKAMGADIIIAIDVGTPMREKGELTGIIEIMEQAMGILEYRIEDENKKLADLIIKPNLSSFKNSDFASSKINGMVRNGLIASRNEITNLLKIKQKVINANNPKSIILDKDNEFIINDIVVNGLNKISQSHFLSLLTIDSKPITIQKLNKKIQSIYGLGYFKIIEYHFVNFDEEEKTLIIDIIEQPENKLRFGIKWDNENQIIISSNIQFTNIPFSGLRIENTFNFGGIRKNIFSIFYPSKGLNFPVYPFIKIMDSWEPLSKFNISGDKTGILNYYNQYISAGIGTNVGNYWITKFNFKIGKSTLDTELNNFSESEILFNKKYYEIASLNLILDNLDNNLSPERGLEFSVKSEYSTKYDNFNFFYLRSFLDTYISLNKHTLRNAIYFHYIDGNAPYPYYLINKSEDVISGLPRFGYFGDKILTSRTEFIYEYKKDIHFHLFYNPILYTEFENISSTFLNSGGVKVQLSSPLGPINLTWSFSPHSIYQKSNFTSNFYLSAGYKF